MDEYEYTDWQKYTLGCPEGIYLLWMDILMGRNILLDEYTDQQEYTQG